jgi:hypothetical protein
LPAKTVLGLLQLAELDGTSGAFPVAITGFEGTSLCWLARVLLATGSVPKTAAACGPALDAAMLTAVTGDAMARRALAQSGGGHAGPQAAALEFGMTALERVATGMSPPAGLRVNAMPGDHKIIKAVSFESAMRFLLSALAHGDYLPLRATEALSAYYVTMQCTAGGLAWGKPPTMPAATGTATTAGGATPDPAKAVADAATKAAAAAQARAAADMKAAAVEAARAAVAAERQQHGRRTQSEAPDRGAGTSAGAYGLGEPAPGTAYPAVLSWSTYTLPTVRGAGERTCWCCGKPTTVCATPHNCGERSGLKVCALAGADTVRKVLAAVLASEMYANLTFDGGSRGEGGGGGGGGGRRSGRGGRDGGRGGGQ